MTVTIVEEARPITGVEEARPITGGVDTHADTHVAAALDPVGGLLGVREFPATAAGYARLLGWLGGFGTVCLAGIEGTGSYGAGLARHITAAGIGVVEVDRSAGRTGAGRASPIPWTRSAPPGPRSPAGPAAPRRAGTARWRRSGP
jgi:transposase